MNIFLKLWNRLNTQTVQEMYLDGFNSAIMSDTLPDGRKAFVVAQVLPHWVDGLTSDEEEEILDLVNNFIDKKYKIVNNTSIVYEGSTSAHNDNPYN